MKLSAGWWKKLTTPPVPKVRPMPEKRKRPMPEKRKQLAVQVIRLACGIPLDVEVSGDRLLAEWELHKLNGKLPHHLSVTDFDVYLQIKYDWADIYDWKAELLSLT